MEAQARARLLLRDALARVLVNPTASFAWHALLDAYAAVENAGSRASARQAIIDSAPREGVAGFLRATFLGGLEEALGHVEEAGEVLQTLLPVDADRLMAFATYEWGRAVAAGGDRTRFVRELRAARLPEIVALAGRELFRVAPAPPRRTIEGVSRVAVVTPLLSAASHPPTVLALKQAALLRQASVAVEVFASQEPLIPGMTDHLGSRGRVGAGSPDLAELAAHAPEQVVLRLGDPVFSLLYRWRATLEAVARFDPDVVLFVGLFSPLIAPLHASRPVLGLCTHSVAPMAPVDAWLTSDPGLAERESAPWGAASPPAWGVHHPFRVSLRASGAPVLRAQLRIGSEALVVVSVGSRLPDEIGGAWAARMVAFLADRPNVIWLLVGGEGIRPSALEEVSDRQLRLATHREDLRSVLQCCDLYANPARLGGGFSVADAMAEGLAVCALRDSDGGDKLGPHAANDLDDYFESLAMLADDPDARSRLGAQLRARFFDSLDLDGSGPSLLEACETALRRFHRRTS